MLGASIAQTTRNPHSSLTLHYTTLINCRVPALANSQRRPREINAKGKVKVKVKVKAKVKVTAKTDVKADIKVGVKIRTRSTSRPTSRSMPILRRRLRSGPRPRSGTRSGTRSRSRSRFGSPPGLQVVQRVVDVVKPAVRLGHFDDERRCLLVLQLCPSDRVRHGGVG